MSQSDLEKIIQRCQTDDDFFSDIMKDPEGTISRENYAVSDEDLEKLKGYLFIEKAKGRFDDFA
jgi:hypothetical protein